jgi:very-short-patch-repair endonuclease
MTLTQANTTSISSKTTSQPLVYELQTTQILKLLSKLLPGYEWTSEWLQQNVKRHGCYTFLDEAITLTYKGQPFGHKTEYLWQIKVDSIWADKLATAYKKIADHLVKGDKSLMALQQVKSLPSQIDNDVNQNKDGTYTWNNLLFRSQAEIEVAKALEKKRAIFFVNAKCRISNRLGITETKETDFLIFYKGTARILEVDGEEYHQNRRLEDYRRDRMFDRQGIRSTRFSASECLKNADEVVDEFLELFSGQLLNNDSQVFSRQDVTIEKQVSKNSNSESKVYPIVPTKEPNPDDIPF